VSPPEGSLPAPPPASFCRPEDRPWILAATVLGSSMAYIDSSVINVVVPVVQQALGATTAEMQWVVNSYLLVLASLLLLGGAASDRWGHKRVFVTGAALFALASLVCGLAPDTGWLIAARALKGLGGAILIPGSLAILRAAYDDAGRAKAIGTWAACSALTTALAPVLGGWLVEAFSWRAIFLINLPMAALVIAFVLWRMPGSRRDGPAGPLDWQGALLAMSGLGCLAYGLIAASERGIGDVVVVGTVLVGLMLLAGFVMVEARAASPMMPLRLFASRAFSGANLLTLLMYIGFTGSLFLVPYEMIQVRHYSGGEAGLAFLPMSVALAAVARPAGSWSARYGARLPLILGPFILAVGLVIIGLLGPGYPYWVGLLPGVTLVGVGMAITIAPLTATIMGTVPAQLAGAASGINNAAGRLAKLISIALLGTMAVLLFESGLRTRLASLDLPEAGKAAILKGYRDLAGMPLPPGLTATQQVVARGAIEESFNDAFRWAMLAGALASLAAAGIGAVTIRPEPKVRNPSADQKSRSA
jgi:EmrB/QacA subfamily drug resistance transporter